MRFSTASAAATKKLAAKLAKEILKSGPHRKHARVVALVGDLGAGKTTFAQGFAKALGIKHHMVSPTFLIFRQYVIARREAPRQSYLNFFHMDAYRINNPKELTPLHFKKILNSAENILLIEWADRIKSVLPKDTIWIEFRHGRSERERSLTVKK